MINTALFNLTERLPCRLIKIDDKPYLERYYVGKVFGVTFYLHRFVSGDAERHMHNHPWKYAASLILAGSYREEVATDLCPQAGPSGCVTETKRVRWGNRIGGAKFHRISDAEPGTWSLFMHGAREHVVCGMVSRPKGWGFLSTEYLLGMHEVTVFKPVDALPTEWWRHSLTGAQTRRAPL